MSDLARRLARLETVRRDAETPDERPRLFVVGQDDPLPEGLRDHDLLICLSYDEEQPHAARLARPAEEVGSAS